MKHVEANFDGLVGPTHNYAGLSVGNVASLSNAKDTSNPKSAAKQGLQKMKALHDMGLVQGVLAPHERPDLDALRRLGFSGNDASVLEQAAKQAPQVLRAVYSASSMWTANAATVSPSADTADKKVHFTPANLTNKFHRSLEPETSGRILKAMFNNEQHFAHHQHLPDNDHFGDEGAANHTRLCGEYDQAGVELFVYGKHAFDSSKPAPTKYPARHTFEASQAVARLHQLNESGVVYMQQNPDVIDQGVFHNDVISVGNQNVLFYHEQAFLNTAEKFKEIQSKFAKTSDKEFHFIKVGSDQVSVDDAVKSYLFNTQLHVKYFDVKQSMRNGGGPACLRLRVALNEQELAATNQNVLMSDALFATLNTWVDKHYRDELGESDLRDPLLVVETRAALDELTQILKLGSVYQFQR